MPLTIRRVVATVVGVMVLVGVFTVSPAGAHRIDESYIYVDIYETTVEGRLEFNSKELNSVLGLGIDESDAEAAEPAIQANRDVIIEYADPRFGLGADGVEWGITYTDIEVLDTENGPFAILHFDVDQDFAEVPDTLDVRYEVFMDEVAGHVGLFHIGNYWEGGVFANESTDLNSAQNLLPFTASNTSETFDLDDPNFLKGLWGVVVLGIDHIRIGTDHILFVLALLLPSVLVLNQGRRSPDGSRSNQWEPSTGFRESLMRVLKLATAFTVAHSITLSLAGFGVVELPSKPVETVIALSIILAALHNLRPVVANKEWVLGFVFGLVHGLGFAGLLSDLGLDRSNRVWSLFAFNIGVEIGQVAIIMLVFPALYLLRRTKLYEIGFRVGSVALAGVAFIWMLERIFEADYKINKFIDPLVEVPRAYFAMAVVTAAAWGWREFERRQGLLRDAAEEPTPKDDEDERELVDAR